MDLAEGLGRFLLGGAAVSAFSLAGDLLRPKTFAGLFGAAPSIALGSLAFVALNQGTSVAAAQGEAMMAGAAAFALYAYMVGKVLMGGKSDALPVSLAGLVLWLGAGLGLLALAAAR